MMSERAKAFWTLYKMSRVSKEALKDAVEKGLLTVEEFSLIVANN